MIFTNVVAYKLNQGKLPSSSEDLTLMLEPLAFTPLLSSESNRSGFFPPTDASDELAVDVGGGTMILALRTDKKSIPGSTIKLMLKEKEKKAESDQGFPVGRKQRREMREDLIDQLLPKVIPTTAMTYIIIHSDEVFIGASGLSAADNAVGLLLTALQGIGLGFPFTTKMPRYMTKWLLDGHVDGDLSVSDFAVLEGDGASIQWKNHDADEQDIKKYINQGKEVTKIRLEYHESDSQLDPITFTLSDKGIIQQIKLHKNEGSTDGSADTAEAGDSDPMSAFISDVSITATVASLLVNALSQALGDNDM